MPAKPGPEHRLASIEADIRVLKWMVGFVGAGVLALLVQSFFGGS